MRGLFSVALACSALGAGDMSESKAPLAENQLTQKGILGDVKRFSVRKARTQVCMTEVGQCQDGCDFDYAVGAIRCSLQGFTAQAAICHAANSAVYGACLAGCR